MKPMLRFVASFALALQSFFYGSVFVRNALRPDDLPADAAAMLALFWASAALLSISSSIVLFQSRGRDTLRGGRWSLGVVVVTCVMTALITLLFGLVGLGEAVQDPPISSEAERWLRAFFLVLTAQSGLSGALAAASLLPRRRMSPARFAEP